MNEKAATYRVRRRAWIMAPVLVWVAGLVPAASGPPVWLTANLPGRQASDELAGHLSDRYRISKVEIRRYPSSRDHAVVWRDLWISGDLTPAVTVVTPPGTDGKVRALADAFLHDEADALFGIALVDIRIAGVHKEDIADSLTRTTVGYGVYVDSLPLQDAGISIGFDKHDRITWVNARLVPIPDALRQAVRRPTLGEQDVRRLVQVDIEDDAKSPDAAYPVKRYPADPYKRPTTVEKLAIAAPPYVIWRVRSIWEYDIDAFTGTVLSKTPGWADIR